VNRLLLSSAARWAISALYSCTGVAFINDIILLIVTARRPARRPGWRAGRCSYLCVVGSLLHVSNRHPSWAGRAVSLSLGMLLLLLLLRHSLTHTRRWGQTTTTTRGCWLLHAAPLYVLCLIHVHSSSTSSSSRGAWDACWRWEVFCESAIQLLQSLQSAHLDSRLAHQYMSTSQTVSSEQSREEML